LEVLRPSGAALRFALRGSGGSGVVKKSTFGYSRLFDACAARGIFREALECARQSHRFGREGDGNESRRRSKHHPLRGVAIPPPSQSGGLATRTP
jgi:hypothetical protein